MSADETLTVKQLLARHYPVKIDFVEEEGEEGYFFAYLPDFGHSACSATGDSAEEALARLAEVKREVFQYHLDSGLPIPRPSPGPHHEQPELQQMPVRIPRDMHDRLKQRAKDSGMTLNAYVTRVFSEHLTMGSMEDRIGEAVQRIFARLAPPVWSSVPVNWASTAVKMPGAWGCVPHSAFTTVLESTFMAFSSHQAKATLDSGALMVSADDLRSWQ